MIFATIEEHLPKLDKVTLIKGERQQNEEKPQEK